MTTNVKFTKFDNTPWGFRLAGGSDFPHPLTVIKVLEGSLAECMGLKVGDVVVRLNDEPVSSLTHGQAHEALVRAGNNFVIGVKREEDPLKALEALNEENIVPYQIPLADLPPVFPEQILRRETPIDREEEEERKAEEEEEGQTVEELPEKPRDADSEVVPNQNLTDDEIAQLILEEEELLTDQGLLGVNFKKLRPRVPVLRESKVVEELQHIATEAPPRVQELQHKSTFLQKPERPVPAPKKKEEPVQEEVEPYRVVIKKQQRRSVTDRLLEKGLLKPSGQRTPEPPAAEVMMPSYEPEAQLLEEETAENCAPVESREILTVHRDDPAPGLRNDDESSVFSLEADRKEPDAAPRRKESRRPVAGKRRLKRFYTRAHYFRRCFLGGRSHGDAKRTSRAKVLPPGDAPENGTLRFDSQSIKIPAEGRRGSLCKYESRGSRFKARYLERYLRREDVWFKQLIAAFLEKPRIFSTGPPERLPGTKLASFRRTRYAERVLARLIRFVSAYFRFGLLDQIEQQDSKESSGDTERNTLNVSLKREASKLFTAIRSCLDFHKRDETSPLRFRKRRLHFKGRYIQHVLRNSVTGLTKRLSCPCSSYPDARAQARRRSSVIRMKGHYMEKCLEQNHFQITSTLADFLESLLADIRGLRRGFFDFETSPAIAVQAKRRQSIRTHYGERIVKRQFGSFGQIAGYFRSQVVSVTDSPASGDVLPFESSQQNSLHTESFDYSKFPKTEPEQARGALSNFLRSSKDYISTEIFHRGSRRLSRSSKRDASIEKTWLEAFKQTSLRFYVSFKLHKEPAAEAGCAEKLPPEKLPQEVERDKRRLSFIPTILHEELTNRIGVDFTRLVAYAFVPCTSIVLLYMYR